MIIIGCVNISYRDLVNTIHLSLHESPKNIKKIDMIIEQFVDMVKILEACSINVKS